MAQEGVSLNLVNNYFKKLCVKRCCKYSLREKGQNTELFLARIWTLFTQSFLVLWNKKSKFTHLFWYKGVSFLNAYERFAYILKTANALLRIPSGNCLCVAPVAQCLGLSKSLLLTGSFSFISSRLRCFVKRP